MNKLSNGIKRLVKMLKINHSRVALVSDIHIGNHLNDERWLEVSKQFFRWFVQELKKHKIKDVIIPGDIFHDRTEIAVPTIQTASEIFEMLKDFNVIITVGNHDAYFRNKSDINSVSIFRGWKNITVIEEVTNLEAFNRNLCFCPWGVKLEEIPQETNIVFGHFEIQSFKLNDFKTCEKGLNPYDLNTKGIDWIISGHFHQKNLRSFKKDGKEINILYLGSPYQLNWGEISGEKGFHIFNLETYDLEFIPNDVSPKHIKVKISEILNQTITIDFIKEHFPKNIIIIQIDKELDSLTIDRLINKFTALKPMIIKTDFCIPSPGYLSTENINMEHVGINIPQAIKEFIDYMDFKGDKEQLKSLALDLFSKFETEGSYLQEEESLHDQ